MVIVLILVNSDNFNFNFIFILSLILFVFCILDNLDLNSKPFENTYANETIDDNVEVSREIDWDYIFDPNKYLDEDTTTTLQHKDNNRSVMIKQSSEGEINDNNISKLSHGYINTSKKINDENFTQALDATVIDTQTNTNTNFNVVAVGDWDCTSETKDTIDNIIEKDPELVLALGDFSYNGKAKCWLDLIEPIANKTKIVMGNHEVESSKILRDYMEFFKLEKQYYSFNYGNVHFLALSTEIPYEEDSQQYEFAIRDLEHSSNDPTVDWIVVFYHRQLYSSGGGPEDEDDFREVYHPLFDKYKVDLALQGHHHVYERIYPITFNSDDDSEPIVQDITPNLYKNPKGPIFLTVGTGGADDMILSSSEDFSAKGIDGKFGILDIALQSNEKTLTGTFIENGKKAKVIDEFKIIK